MFNSKKKKILKSLANLIRQDILNISHMAKSSHLGSCLSIVDILTVFYKSTISSNLKRKINLKYQFILSKGHACLALYCTLYRSGILKKNFLQTYGNNNSLLMQHVSHKVPGISFSTGSLGHGLPVATGLALSSKLKKDKKKIFVLLSDGELDEGTTWESLMFAAHHKLNNLIVIIDYNKLQSLTFVKKTINVEPLENKFKSFGCNVRKINGHDYSQIEKIFLTNNKNKPLVVIANTVKGKGVSFMENKIEWHYKSPNNEELEKALKELKDA